jgi:hypothetical protein
LGGWSEEIMLIDQMKGVGDLDILFVFELQVIAQIADVNLKIIYYEGGGADVCH